MNCNHKFKSDKQDILMYIHFKAFVTFLKGSQIVLNFQKLFKNLDHLELEFVLCWRRLSIRSWHDFTFDLLKLNIVMFFKARMRFLNGRLDING